jgi:hypothetical protein
MYPLRTRQTTVSSGDIELSELTSSDRGFSEKLPRAANFDEGRRSSEDQPLVACAPLPLFPLPSAEMRNSSKQVQLWQNVFVANFSDAWNQVLQECSEMGMSREQHEEFVARIRRIIDFEPEEEDGIDGAEALEGYDSDEATPQKHSQLESSSDEGETTEREETPTRSLEIEDGWRGYKYEATTEAEEELQDGDVAVEEERARWGVNSSTRSIISTKQPSISSKAQTAADDDDEVLHNPTDEEERNNEEAPRSTDEA